MKAQNVAYIQTAKKKSAKPATEEQSMKIICFASKKGGVSKTTSAIITGLMLAEKF